MSVTLDETDRAVLEVLRKDARTSMRELAEAVHVSRASAYARVKRLQETGVLLGFTTVVDPIAMGLGLPAYVHVRVKQNTWKGFKAKALDLPEVVQVSLVAGDFDALLLVRTHDAAELRDLVLERIQSMPEVLSTQTVLVFEEGRA
ncbi:MAG: transcriptional regulator, AsnC family [Frankiales bacterium]|jgi:DNA-binding Lrp family transcriptional regulator|nr:transcriptional regulator, AsnC family [Frankiales bacterium]